jgi:tetratricopeptide (TPR) repeat protein
LAQKTKTEKAQGYGGSGFSVPCHFIRSITFAPDDPMVRFAYGLHLSNFGKKEEALIQFLKAEELGRVDSNTLYNIGLLYVEKKDYEKGLAYAKRAYAGGFPLPGLRDRLKRAGKWEE